VSEFNVRYWRKQKDDLQTTNKSRKTFRRPKSGNLPEVEDEILEYVTGLSNSGVGVSHEIFHFKAREIATRQGISPCQTPLYFDMPTNTTFEGKGEKSVIIRTSGCEKQHCDARNNFCRRM
jgi:hypothetical protein